MPTIKELRNQAGLSQSQLAKLSGVKLRTLQHYEQGQRDINGANLTTLVDLADALQCPITELLTNAELKSKLRKVTL